MRFQCGDFLFLLADGLLKGGGVDGLQALYLTGELDDLVAGVNGILVAANAGF